ncbi:LOW QUALITY PROTEIN: membrane metallo-endopeptidase-like 1 [Drosophila sechellia]|uniref:LOW QUALITY PROTEIN: membrane metallo-endopeptidase-like 1 n=1 Tax=Drosophila sechellia TaxID=7238 RepID=UPI0013DD97C9|nr:LOW QUALITY PROTEIN: membrane metallo-endopeptidase-like 1 [Drosophila sechellia]
MWIICLLLLPLVAASSNTRLLNGILNHVDKEANPCENFYNHACGQYNMRHMDDTFFDIIQMLDHQVNQNLVKLMDELELSSQSPDFNVSSVDGKVLRYYLSCRGSPRNMDSLSEYLKVISPGEGLTWPQFIPDGSSWPQEKFKWLETLAHLHRYGLTNVFFNLEVVSNPRNATEYMVELNTPTFGEESQLPNSFIEILSVLYVMKVPSGEIITLARKIRTLELSLELMINPIDRPNNRYISIRDFEMETGHNWQRFFEILIGSSAAPELQVLVRNFRYFTSLKELMDKQDARLVASYIMTRLAIFLFDETTGGSESTECVSQVRRNMNLAASMLYKERFFEHSAFSVHVLEIKDIFEKLRHQFLQQVDQNHLELTALQKKFVVGKAEAIEINVGNLPRTDNLRQFVGQYYQDLQFPTGDLDYHQLHLNVLQFRTQKMLAQSSKAHSEEQNILTYRSQAAPLPPPQPFFQLDSEDVFKYSLMGYILAHHLISAFATEGITIGSDGNDQPFRSHRFEEAVSCLSRSSENIDETMGDIAGLELAYSTYAKMAKNRNRLEFTHLPPEQIFFLNAGQFFCGNSDMLAQYKEDQVLLQRAIDGFEPFDRAFGCNRNKPQHEKCRLW